jgi:hypothetical protein
MRPDDLAWSDIGPWPSTGDVSPAARGGRIAPPLPHPARKQVRIDRPDSVAVGDARAGQGALPTPVLDRVDIQGRAPTGLVLDLVNVVPAGLWGIGAWPVPGDAESPLLRAYTGLVDLATTSRAR